MTALVQSGNSASIYGHATDDGAVTMDLLHVVDDGEPGTGLHILSILTGTGFAASETLTGGTIQAH